jgi:hypothetical protein
LADWLLRRWDRLGHTRPVNGRRRGRSIFVLIFDTRLHCCILRMVIILTTHRLQSSAVVGLVSEIISRTSRRAGSRVIRWHRVINMSMMAWRESRDMSKCHGVCCILGRYHAIGVMGMYWLFIY